MSEPAESDPMAGRGTILVPVGAAAMLELQRWADRLHVGLGELMTAAAERYARQLAAGDEGSGPT